MNKFVYKVNRKLTEIKICALLNSVTTNKKQQMHHAEKISRNAE